VSDSQYLYSISVAINTPSAHAWPIMSDVERWAVWTASIRKVRRLDSGPLAVGSKAWVFQPEVPPALWQVTAREPGRSFTWVSRGPGVRATGHHLVEPAPEGAKVMLSLEYSGFFSPLVARLTASLNDRYLGLEAAGLKKQSEETFAR
jgi:hypothetical protein